MRILASILGIALVLAGCTGGSNNFDPNYKTEVKMTEAETARVAEEAKMHPGPGTISNSTGQKSAPATKAPSMKMPPPKGVK